MKDVTDKNFGVIIAFLLPGFLLLWGLSYSSKEIAGWLTTSANANGPAVGGFLYATLASLALGLLVSAIRWLIIDTFLHHVTRLKYPDFDFSKLKDKDAYAVFQGAVENHYRYYQYYANTLIALIAAFSAYASSERPSTNTWIIVSVLAFALLLASRDSLKKYYDRAVKIAGR
jgi:chromate transport protein ChrA